MWILQAIVGGDSVACLVVLAIAIDLDLVLVLVLVLA